MPTITLSVSHYMPPDHGTHADFIGPWARAVEERSGGALRLQVHDGTTPLGLLANQYDQVASGAVDIAHSPGHLPPGRFPLTSIIGAPFLAESSDAGTRLLWRLLPTHLQEEYHGLEVLALHADTGGLLHTRDRPIERLEDLQGLRIRTPNPLIGAAFARLGAVPVQIPPPEINAALRAGAIDGAAMPWDVVIYTGSADFLRFHLDTRLYVAPLYFVMNRASYERLPPALQQAIDDVSGDALVARFGAWWSAWERPGIDEVLKRGHAVSRLSAEERARWQRTVEPVIDSWLGDLERAGATKARAVYAAARQALEVDK